MGGAPQKGAFFMNITVNGKSHDHRGDGSLDVLLVELGANLDAVALMVNERVIPRAERSSVRLQAGDQVEVLSFMGGG